MIAYNGFTSIFKQLLQKIKKSSVKFLLKSFLKNCQVNQKLWKTKNFEIGTQIFVFFNFEVFLLTWLVFNKDFERNFNPEIFIFSESCEKTRRDMSRLIFTF